MARHAAIPLPVPRSAAAGGVGARPGKSLAPDRPRGQAGGLAAEEAAAGRGRAGDRSPLSSWLEPGVESRGAGFRGPAGSRRPESERPTPDHAGGKTQARVQGCHSAIGRAWGSRRLPKPVGEALRTVTRAWASGKAELEDDRGRAGQRASWRWGGPPAPSSQRRAHEGRGAFLGPRAIAMMVRGDRASGVSWGLEPRRKWK